jgi:type VI secretion system protein
MSLLSGVVPTRRILMIVLLAGLTSACGSSDPNFTVVTKNYRITSSPFANQNTAVAVDVVLIFDPKLFDSALKMSAAQWFKNREQIQLDFPKQVTVISWELVPGQQIPFQPLPKNTDEAEGAIVFAHYLSPGDHRVRFGLDEAMVISLGQNDFVIKPDIAP